MCLNPSGLLRKQTLLLAQSFTWTTTALPFKFYPTCPLANGKIFPLSTQCPLSI